MKTYKKVIIGLSTALAILLIISFSMINNLMNSNSSSDKEEITNNKTEQYDTKSHTAKVKDESNETSNILDDNIIYNNSIGNIKVGMSINDFKKEIEKSTRTIKNEFISLEGDDYEVYSVYENDKLLYKIEPECNTECLVWRIWIYGESLKTENGIGVGSSLGEILKSYKKGRLSTEEGFLFVPENRGYSFSLSNDQIPVEWWSNPKIETLDKEKTMVSEIIISN